LKEEVGRRQKLVGGRGSEGRSWLKEEVEEDRVFEEHEVEVEAKEVKHQVRCSERRQGQVSNGKVRVRQS
jgi:hypothetical protein